MKKTKNLNDIIYQMSAQGKPIDEIINATGLTGNQIGTRASRMGIDKHSMLFYFFVVSAAGNKLFRDIKIGYIPSGYENTEPYNGIHKVTVYESYGDCRNRCRQRAELGEPKQVTFDDIFNIIMKDPNGHWRVSYKSASYW